MPTVLIYWSPGRSEKQKAAVIQDVTETLVSKANARREDVLIIFQDIQPGDAGRGGMVLGAPAPFDLSNVPEDGQREP